MKIIGIVVLYNPDPSVIDNINTYINILDELIVFDNTEKDSEVSNLVSKMPLVTYCSKKQNIGIAGALRHSMNIAIDKGADWCFTMDQDSSVDRSIAKRSIITNSLEKHKEYAIVGLNYTKKKVREYTDVKRIITAGNFINVKKYKKIDGFREDLFIDFVDFDLCEQLNRIHEKVCIIEVPLIQHIGEPVNKKFLFLNIKINEHNPIRTYYRYRNCVYLFMEHKLFYFKTIIFEFTINLFNILFFENEKKKKILMIKKAINDARCNKLGKLSLKRV